MSLKDIESVHVKLNAAKIQQDRCNKYNKNLMDTKCCCLLLGYQETRHSNLASPKGAGANGQVHTYQHLIVIFHTTDNSLIHSGQRSN